MGLQSPMEAAWSQGPECCPPRPMWRPGHGWVSSEAGRRPWGQHICIGLSIPSASPQHPLGIPGPESEKQNGFLGRGAGEEGISHLLNELIRAQRFHFEEAAGLSSISVLLDLRRSGGEGAISNTCSPGGFHGGEVVGLNGRRPPHGSPKAGFKMNGANCSSSCHISRADTKPLLTHKTMSLCKSPRPTGTSPQPRTTRWAGGARSCPHPATAGPPAWHRHGASWPLPACPWVLQPPPGPTRSHGPP